MCHFALQPQSSMQLIKCPSFTGHQALFMNFQRESKTLTSWLVVSNIEGKPLMVDQISPTISTSSELHNLQSCFEWMENCWNTGIFAENLIQNEELLNEEDPGDCSVPYGSDGSSGVRLSSPRQFPAPSGVDYHAPLLSCWMPRALSVLAGKLGWKDTEFNPQAIVVTPL